MKNVKFLLTVVLSIFVLLSCEKQDSNDFDNFSFPNPNKNFPFVQNDFLVSAWSFENSLEDEIGDNDFYAELMYDICWYDYIPGKVGTCVWVSCGQLKCDMENLIISDQKDFSFFFWGSGYNQQDVQHYFSIDSYYYKDYLSLIVKNAYLENTDTYLATIIANGTTYKSVNIDSKNKWNFYGITYKKPNLSFYVNGKLESTFEWNYENYYTDNYFIVFSPYDNFNYINIDNAKLYNKAFKQNEVFLLYKSEN